MNEKTEPILTWDRPMTSKRASRYLLTNGFVAVELWRADKNKYLAAEATHKAEISGLVEALSRALEDIIELEVSWGTDTTPHSEDEIRQWTSERLKKEYSILAPYKQVPCKECGGIRTGKPCNHPGCLAHQTHPCEKCGRVGGVCPHCTDGMMWNKKSTKDNDCTEKVQTKNLKSYHCRDCGHDWIESEPDYFDRMCECPECESNEIDEGVDK